MKPKKSLGQNFLIDLNVANRIVDAISPLTTDTVVEIGPGKGILTKILAGRVEHLICIEMDDFLSQNLKSKLNATAKFKIINADALKIDISDVIPLSTQYKLIGNLPYNVASPIIRHYLTMDNKPSFITVMLQKEVADLIAAKPGKMGYLSVEFQLRSTVEKLFTVHPSVFKPAPKVKSTVITMKPHEKSKIIAGSESEFLTLVRAGFSAPRKQIHNCLQHSLELSKDLIWDILKLAGIDLKNRPQTLSLEDWIRLYTVFLERGVNL